MKYVFRRLLSLSLSLFVHPLIWLSSQIVDYKQSLILGHEIPFLIWFQISIQLQLDFAHFRNERELFRAT